MARTDPQINIRIPEELKAQLEDRAKANKRSLTAEVVSRLEESILMEPTPMSLEESIEIEDSARSYQEKILNTPDSQLDHAERYMKEDIIRTAALRKELMKKYFPDWKTGDELIKEMESKKK